MKQGFWENVFIEGEVESENQDRNWKTYSKNKLSGNV